MDKLQAKIMAQAVYEIQSLLRGYLGSDAESDVLVRQAAYLAYALHNEALAVIEGKDFDTEKVISKVQAMDRLFEENGGYFTAQFSRLRQSDKA